MTTVTTSVPRSPASSLRRNPAAAWRHLDLVLVGCVAAVSLLGTLMVYSATRGPTSPYRTELGVRQGIYVVMGWGILLAATLIDYRRFRDWAVLVYAAACGLLALVVSPLGSSTKGTQAWFQLGAFQLQPSELAKVGLILLFALLAANFQGEIDLRRLGVLVSVAVLPLGLILLQPDLGTGLVLVSVTAGMMLVAGVQGKHLLALLFIGVLGVAFALQSDVLEEYQKERLTGFLDQSGDVQASTYNVDQSKVAISNGGAFGQGLFEGSQTRLAYVPEQHTDFIFTAVGEQLGFLGGATLLSLFSIIAWRVWRTAQLARDAFGVLVCAGVLSMLLFQVFENVGMTMGIMPVTGIPLPFVSYGGSSTIAQFLAMGLVLNIHARRFS